MLSISLNTRSKWKVNIPISNVMGRIGVCLALKTIGGETADGITINEQITMAVKI